MANMNGFNKNKCQPLTHVWRNCEFCGKFTFAFRKKFYLSGKYAVTKFATDAKRGNVSGNPMTAQIELYLK